MITCARKLSCVIFACSFIVLIPISNAQSVKRIYIANDDHTDYMWTANEARYDTAFVKMLDYYLDAIDATKKNPDDFQARFNCDGSYWIRAYEKYRSPQQYLRLINSIRSGHISVPLNFMVSTYGAQPMEAVFRGMFHAGQLERSYNLHLPLAVCMENQTLPLGLSSLWAGSGAKYSWRGVCGCASRISNASLSSRRNQLYRYTGLDGSSVIMKWYNRPIYNGRTLGGYAESRREKKPADPVKDMGTVIGDLEAMCDTISKNTKYPFNVAAAFGYGWDDIDNFSSPAFVESAKAYSNKNRTVRVSNEEDFFKDIENTYPILPVETISYGNEWDTYSSTMNEVSARVRRSIEKLRSAEAMYAMIAVKNHGFGNQLTALRKQAWEAYGFYWEHDWTADSPTVPQVLRANWQVRIANQITAYTDSLYATAHREMAKYINGNTSNRFYVFNPLSWERNDVADILYAGSPDIIVKDITTNKEVASQMIQQDGKSFLRIWAENIPSTGYKVFEIQKGKPAFLPAAATVNGQFISNRFYRIAFSNAGVITAIYDSLAGSRQLVMPAQQRYLNDLGTKDISNGNIDMENLGPVSYTRKIISNDPVKHTVYVTVFAHKPSIEILDSIQSNFRDVKTWNFSFNLNNQVTRHEELGAVLTVKKETRGGNYAAQNARYDWQTFNHFADMSEAKYGITISNQDCGFFRLGQSTPDSLWENSTQLSALAGGQLDRYTLNPSGWKDTLMMGVYNQFGQTDFRYQFALSTHNTAFDPVQSMKFSLEHQNPLITGDIEINNLPDRYPQDHFSLLSVSDPAVLLWSLKPAEEGIEQGILARFWNLKNTSVKPTIKLWKPVTEAWKTSHIETNQSEIMPVKGSINIPFNPWQINTVRLFTESRSNK